MTGQFLNRYYSQFCHIVHRYYPGVIVAGILALAAQFISDYYGASTMLMALLFGMALNFLSKEKRCVEGINFTAQKVLRVGVCLLGARISFDMISAVGLVNVAITVMAVLATIGFGIAMSKWFNIDRYFAFLTSGSVAICGASAALAIAAIMPKHKKRDEELIFTVAGVTILSTFAMILYPILGQKIGLSGDALGVFLGATIHDVAQVVGAGYSVDEPTGDIATIIKLLRVAMLAPVVVIAGLIIRFKIGGKKIGGRKIDNRGERESPPILPVFVLGFIIFLLANSFGILPHIIKEGFQITSRWFLVMAIAAFGMKIDLSELRHIGKSAFFLIIAETIFVAVFVTSILFV